MKGNSLKFLSVLFIGVIWLFQGPQVAMAEKGKPEVSFGEAFSGDAPPLEKAIKEKVDKRRNKEKNDLEKKKNDLEKKGKTLKPREEKCLAAFDLPDDTDEEKEIKEKEIKKNCKKSPGREKKVLKKEDIMKGGKKKGKKIKTTTTLKFENAGQRYGHDKRTKWDRVVMKPPQTGDLTARSYRGNSTNTKDKARNKTLLVDDSQAINDDKDCVDSVTGEHMGGVTTPGGEPVSDGAPESCFDIDGNLKATLTAVEGGCQHENGIFFEGATDDVEDECYDENNFLKTTIVELFDEDPYSPDIDGDGRVGEDPPNPGTDPINDDKDCVDTLTGEHLGGPSVPDGTPKSCFAANGDLKGTLSMAFSDGGCEDAGGTFFEGDPNDSLDDDCWDANNDLKPGMFLIPDGCMHENGTFLAGAMDGEDDECYDENNVLKTTLAELIDEDDGEPVDDDGDGVADEDGPTEVQDFAEACRDIGRQAGLTNTSDMITEDGGCDLTRVVVVKANKEAKDAPGGKKFYKADDEGYDDPDADGDALYGDEERQVVIEETFTVMCEGDMVLDEATGQCVPESQTAALAAYRASRSVASVTQATAFQDEAMMGFTFAPPRVRWGIYYKEELDLFFFSITLFEIKFGYDFGMGVGFRLPTEVSVSNLPGASILAESTMDLQTNIMPRDFTVQNYKDFCLSQVPPMGNAAFCERFAFSDAFVPEEGDELAIRLAAFAGLKVVILGIPIVNWGIDVDMDLPEMCSLYFALNEEPDKLALEVLNQQGNFGKAITALGLNCGTYTTPFGNDEDGNPRQFPFIANAPFVNQMVRADCAEAFVRGETIKLPDGIVVPICTGLILGVPGASLGLGLGMDLEINSNLIEADVNVSGDGTFDPSDPFNPQKNTTQIGYTKSANESGSSVAIPTVTVDNYDDGDYADNAVLNFNDFTYCLNTFSIRLKGQMMFGGILTLFPDFDDFTIYRFTLPISGCGIPIGQHADTSGVTVPVFVENYGIEVKVETDPADPLRVDEKTLKVKPGEFGEFIVSVKNIGSVNGDFDEFGRELSNRRVEEQADPFTFVINSNTDFDCRDGGNILRGNPYDGVEDDCWDANNQLKAGMEELVDEDDFGPAGALREERDEDKDGMVDEDAPEDWRTEPTETVFNGQAIFQVAPHTYSVPQNNGSGESLTLAVSPFRHPLTKPGVYPFRVTGDSRDAKTLGLSPMDPSGNYRQDAQDVAFVEVDSFFDPQVAVQPAEPSAKPGVPRTYMVEGTNMGNVEDSMALALEFIDFNQAGCTLTTMGTDPGCPFRAVPTIIQDPDWTDASGLVPGFGPLEPLGSDTDTFMVTVPSDWAGMGDTVYEFVVTVTSGGDPAVQNSVTVRQTVQATKESMTRYIGLEIQELIAEIEDANAQGIRTGGLLPISLQPAQRKADQALELVLAGKFPQASNALSSNIRIMEAFLHALDGFNGKGAKIPAEMDSDWHMRANAIIQDLGIAEASSETSAQ